MYSPIMSRLTLTTAMSAKDTSVIKSAITQPRIVVVTEATYVMVADVSAGL